ncbi:DUF6492 family protein [Flavobacterium phragmitis]|uniref:Glycosyl transferase family 8 n=1 Tax=Flavobacterium phragmitis TaxID=739143 RepID=A0A1I1K2C1_9FLAO|nr:DUF6492 family protein [Flavobacterium phragmitis]SFC52123.1 hypothetical protein SAMN05216297_101113 [Flavobacterium phragmitis]
MYKLILFIKTYEPDFKTVYKLLDSIDKFNQDNIPVIISVNDDHFDFLKPDCFEKYKVYRDSEIFQTTVTEGWRYQQIIKCNVYRLNICENYVAIDSDSVFIRDFYISDFMFDENTPYTIMQESKDLLEMTERLQMDSQTIFFKRALRDTRPFFGNKGKEWDYGPSPYIWNCKVWEHFNEVFLKDLNLDFDTFFTQIDKKSYSPSDCVIYGEYLLKTRLINIIPIGSLFKVYHYKRQYAIEKNQLNMEQLSKIYLGLIHQSNWKRKKKKWYRFFQWN